MNSLVEHMNNPRRAHRKENLAGWFKRNLELTSVQHPDLAQTCMPILNKLDSLRFRQEQATINEEQGQTVEQAFENNASLSLESQPGEIGGGI